jgi:hypothetical protein
MFMGVPARAYWVDPWDSNHHQLGCVETSNCTPKGKPTVENPTFHGRMAMVSFDVPKKNRPLKYGLN